jgi:two-component system, sensor histidine kinase and response regulator
MTYSRNLILVVDDNPTNLQIAWAILDEAGYEVAFLNCGKNVCDFAATEPVSLILLDIMMPDLNGFEVCRQLKSNPKTKNIPVIFQTALTSQEDIVRGFEAGAVDYVVKPYHPPEFRKRIETHLQLRNTTELLAEKNAELTHYIHTISHDLRSPLLTISAYIEEMKLDFLQGNQEQVLQDQFFVDKAINRMQNLLDGLLQVAKAGDTNLKLESLTLNELATEVSGLVAGRIKEHPVNIQIPSAIIPIYGDRSKLIQVLQNLVENAIKYKGTQSQPSIEIGAVIQGKSPVYFVKDNGKGIEAELLPKIFDVFQQSDASAGGAGLGLSLVKRIIEAHKGRIWVESPGLGQGSVFYFTIGNLVNA